MVTLVEIYIIVEIYIMTGVLSCFISLVLVFLGCLSVWLTKENVSLNPENGGPAERRRRNKKAKKRAEKKAKEDMCYCEKPEEKSREKEKNENKTIALLTVCKWLKKYNTEYQNSKETIEDCNALIAEREAAHQEEIQLLREEYEDCIYNLEKTVEECTYFIEDFKQEETHKSLQHTEVLHERDRSPA